MKIKRAEIVLILLSCLVALLLLELGLRGLELVKYGTFGVPGWLQVANDQTRQPHPFLRSVPKPNARFTATQDGETAEIAINSLGFRSPEISADKPAGTFRVFCTGGSVVYDTRVSLEESWPYQLQLLLRERFPERAIEIVNGGIPGRTSADSLVNVALRGLPLEPDLVIVLHGINDPKTNRFPDFKPDYSHYYGDWSDPRPTLLDKAIDHTMLGARLRNLLTTAGKRGQNKQGIATERYDTVTQPGLDTYRRNLVSIAGMSQANGAKVAFLVPGSSLDGNVDWSPESGKPSPMLYYYGTLTMDGIRDAFAKYNGVTREAAEAVGAHLVDLDALLPTGQEHYQDDVHYTPAGSRAVAEILAKELPWEALIGTPADATSVE